MSSVLCPSVWLWRWWIKTKKSGNLEKKLHKQLVQHLCSSYRSTKAIHPCVAEHGELSGRLEVGWEKVAYVLEHRSGNISDRHKERWKLLRRANRNSSMLFQTGQSPIPYGHLFRKIGGSQPCPKLQSRVCQERVKLRITSVAGKFIGSIRTKAR